MCTWCSEFSTLLLVEYWCCTKKFGHSCRWTSTSEGLRRHMLLLNSIDVAWYGPFYKNLEPAPLDVTKARSSHSGFGLPIGTHLLPSYYIRIKGQLSTFTIPLKFFKTIPSATSSIRVSFLWQDPAVGLPALPWFLAVHLSPKTSTTTIARKRKELLFFFFFFNIVFIFYLCLPPSNQILNSLQVLLKRTRQFCERTLKALSVAKVAVGI